MRSLLQSIILLVLFSGTAYTQEPGIYFDNLDINQSHIRVYNSADMGWDMVGWPKWEVPAGGGVHGNFASSFWIGGLDLSTNLHIAAQTYRQRGNDFFAGPYRTTGNYEALNSYAPTFNVVAVKGLSNGRIVFVGDNELEEYDPATGNTRGYSYNNLYLYADIVELANGNILLYGDRPYPDQNPLVEIDQATFTGTVTDTLDLWQGRSVVETLTSGQILFAGYFGCELYDPVTQTSSLAASMNNSRLRAASILLPNGNVLVSGGTITINGAVGISSMEIYDPVQDTWFAAPAMSVGRRDHSMIEAANGEIIIIGGSLIGSTVDHFDPVMGTLSTNASLDGLFVATNLGLRQDGRILVSTVDQVEPPMNLFIYDPATGAVEEGHTSTILGKGADLANGNVMPLFSDGSYKELDIESTALAGQRWQRIWKVSKAEIDQFIQDYQNGNVDFSQYPVIEEWPAHGSVADGEDRFLAPFVDVDQDSVYDPAGDGDYPCIEGDQAMWWVFNDDAGMHSETDGTKLGVQVEVMAYAFDCDTSCPVLWLDHTTFFHYEITNKSFTEYNNVYVSFFSDGDVGNWTDNYYGVDTALGLGIAYNGDAEDETLFGTTGDYMGYGLNPPAIGNLVLSGPDGKKLTHYMTFSDTLGINGFPSTPDAYYSVQQAVWPSGDPLTVGGNGLGGTAVTTYAYPGDPGFCGPPPSGWYQDQPEIFGSQFTDLQTIQSAGPFDLAAGETVNYDFASIYARSYNFENLASVCELKAAASQLKPFFANLNKDCLNLVVGKEEQEEPKQMGRFELYPNPARDQVSLELDEPLKEVTKIELINQYGQRLLNQTMRPGQRIFTFSIQALPSGVYSVRISGNAGTSVKKLVIQH